MAKLSKEHYFLYREKSVIFTLCFVGFVLRFGAWLMSEYFVVSYRLPDDALYYFTIAKHLAQGAGISFDGITPTNGFHPLWLFIITPIFLLNPSNWGGIGAVLALQTLLDLFIIWGVGTAILRMLPNVRAEIRMVGLMLGTATYALNPAIIVRGINGLETTITALILLLWTVQYYRLYHLDEWKHTKDALPLGILTGLLLLARTDMILVVAPAMAFAAVRKWKLIEQKPGVILLVIGPTLLLLLPWIYWNWFTFGSINQVSASAVPYFSHKKLDVLFSSASQTKYLINEAGTTLLKPFYYCGFGLPAITVIVALVVLNRGKRKRDDEAHEIRISIASLFPIMFGVFLLLGYHIFVRTFIRDWYVLQLIPIVSVLFGLSVCSVFTYFVRWRIVFVTLLTAAALGGLWWSEQVKPRYGSQRIMMLSGIPLIESLPKGTHVGALNSGWYGYFSPKGTVVHNLDGVVNLEAFDAIKRGDMRSYLTKSKIDYVIDLPGDLNGYQGLIDHNLLADYTVDTVLHHQLAADSLYVYQRNGK